MRGGYVKKFFCFLAFVFCLGIGVIFGEPVTAYAAGSVELYVDGELIGTYDGIMHAFEQMTDATESYVIRLKDESQIYQITEGYTWPAVERITIQGPASDSFAFVTISGDNTLQGDLGLQGVVVQFDEDAAEPGFSIKMQNHRVYIDGDVHISGENSWINTQTGEYFTEIVGELVGNEGSGIVIEGGPELFCDLTVDEMILSGAVDFRGGKSQSIIKRLETDSDSRIDLNSIYYVSQSGGGVNVSIGSCVIHGREDEVMGQSFMVDIGTSGSSFVVGDIIFDQEVGLGLCFNYGSLSNGPDFESVDVALNGEFENISYIQVQMNQVFSTFSAYKDEFSLDKLFIAPEFAGEVRGYCSAFCSDISQYTSGTFEAKKVEDTFYVDRDSIYLEEPSGDDTEQEIQSGEWIYVRTEEGTADIRGYVGEGAEVVRIPDTIDGLTVSIVSIMERTWYEADGTPRSTLEGVKEVIIPASATDVSAHAFMVHELFGDISVLEKLTVLEGNTAYKSIDGVLYTADGETVVAVPQAIDSVELPEGIRWIEEYAFYNCINLKKLYIPDTVEAMVTGSLRECDGLVDLRLSQNMESIFMNVGIGCDSLKRLYMPELKKCTMACADTHGYFDNIFASCANLDEVVFLDDNIKLLYGAENIFADCAPNLVAYCTIGSQTESVLQGLGFRTKSLDELQVLRLYDENISLNVGESHQNYLLRNPYDEAYFESPITWTSSDESVATVDKNGLIVAASFGETTISATCNGTTVSTKVRVAKTKEDLLRDFVTRMYTVALGRDADESGVEFWVDNLYGCADDGASISKGFILGPEFTGYNYSNSEFIEILYHTYFNRELDADGEAFWSSALESGATREQVLAGFVNSPEFFNLCRTYEINRGYMNEDGSAVNPGIYRFAERLYSVVLQRQGDEGGIESWTVAIASGGCTPEAAAQEFFMSEEYLMKWEPDEEFVKKLYRTFMDREADQAGIDSWIAALDSGATYTVVIQSFAACPEFQQIKAQYGL